MAQNVFDNARGQAYNKLEIKRSISISTETKREITFKELTVYSYQKNTTAPLTHYGPQLKDAAHTRLSIDNEIILYQLPFLSPDTSPP